MRLLKALDKQLENKSYFCGEELTVADILYYSEIVTITALTKKEISESEYPHLGPWYSKRMRAIP